MKFFICLPIVRSFGCCRLDVSTGCLDASLGSLRHAEWNVGAFGVHIQAL